MKITDEQKKAEQRMFTAVWEFYKKYFNPEDNERYWDEMVQEGGRLGESLGNPLGVKMILDIMEELNRKHKERNGGQRQ